LGKASTSSHDINIFAIHSSPRGKVYDKKTFFDIFTEIALFVGQPEHVLFQEGRRQAQTLFLIADATYAVFTPAVCAHPL
jgi:hypothetical protein